MVKLDDAFDCYEMRKQDHWNDGLWVYDLETEEFCRHTAKVKKFVPFLDSRQECLDVMEGYLALPHVKKHQQECKQNMKESGNQVVAFLWFFEHIDGCYDFGNFEMSVMTKRFIQWCNRNQLEFVMPEVYVQNNEYSIY